MFKNKTQDALKRKREELQYVTKNMRCYNCFHLLYIYCIRLISLAVSTLVRCKTSLWAAAVLKKMGLVGTIQGTNNVQCCK